MAQFEFMAGALALLLSAVVLAHDVVVMPRSGGYTFPVRAVLPNGRSTNIIMAQVRPVATCLVVSDSYAHANSYIHTALLPRHPHCPTLSD